MTTTTSTTKKKGTNEQEAKYYSQFPQLVWALARNPYDIAFWLVVRDIAGPDGECYLTTNQLATLAMMGDGTAADCRKYLLDQGLLIGEIRQDAGFSQPVWHLRIPNIWDRNIKWAEAHPSPQARINYKLSREERTFKQKTCTRCHAEYSTAGRTSYRCPGCQDEENREKDRLFKHFGNRLKEQLVNESCHECQSKEKLELHILEDDKTITGTVVLCRTHHDKVHEREPRAQEDQASIHSKKDALTSQYSSQDSGPLRDISDSSSDVNGNPPVVIAGSPLVKDTLHQVKGTRQSALKNKQSNNQKENQPSSKTNNFNIFPQIPWSNIVSKLKETLPYEDYTIMLSEVESIYRSIFSTYVINIKDCEKYDFFEEHQEIIEQTILAITKKSPVYISISCPSDDSKF